MTPAQRAQSSQQLSPLAVQIRKQIPLYRQAIYFSLITSLLMLAPTLFMLEVYDRVVNSRSTTTLIMLIICVIGIYVVMEALEVVRGKLMRQAGERVDAALRSLATTSGASDSMPSSRRRSKALRSMFIEPVWA